MNEISMEEIAYSLSNEYLHLIVLPTEKCNFRCTYCYEDFLNGKMPLDTHKKIYLDISESFYVCNFCLEEIPFSIDPRKIYKHQAYECVAMPDDKLGFMQAKHIKIKQFRPRELAMLAHMIKNNLTETTNLMFHPFDASFDKDNNLIIKLH